MVKVCISVSQTRTERISLQGAEHVPLNEMVKKFLWLAECPVGGQECSDELRVSIHVICESLHEFKQRAPLDEWTLRPVLVVLKHYVLIGVLNRKPDANTLGQCTKQWRQFQIQ